MTARTELRGRISAALDGRGAEPAIAAADWQADYATFADWAKCLAVALGRCEGSVVAVAAPDRVAAAAATVAVLGAGAILMHADARQPLPRQAELLRAVDPDVIVSAEPAGLRLAEAAWGQPAPRMAAACLPVCLPGGHSARLAIAFRPGGTDEDRWKRSPLLGDPADASYLCATTGSTGAPKLIVGSAAGLLDYLDWELAVVPPGGRVSQLTFPRFDAYLRDVLVPLLSGGAICLPAGWDVPLGNDLAAWLAAAEIDVLHTVPSVVRSVEADAVAAGGHHVGAILLAGDRLYGSDVRPWLTHSPRTRVLNLYGPTETTMIKLAHELDSGADDGPVPIGRPIGRSQAVVLGADDTPCAPGRIGEIVIRTAFQPLGYYGPDPALGRFTANPLNPSAGGTVFRTGDRGRMRRDGAFEFAGRQDDQVKIRGVRLALGDVEQQIRRLPGLRDAMVVAVSAEDREQELVAVYAGDLAARDAQKQWQSALAVEMRPARAVRVPRLPVTANGKLDRKAVTAVAVASRHASSGGRPAAGEAAWPVRSIWADLLGRDDLTPDDNFFEVGGTSLSAVRLLARIARECGYTIGLGEFFERPTIAGILDRVTAKTVVSTLVRLAQSPEGPDVYLVHPAGGFVSSYAEIATALAGDCAVHGLQAAGLTDGSAPDATIEAMAARYLADIGARIGERAYCLAGWSAGGLVAFEMARQLAVGGAPAGSLVLLDSAPPGFYSEPDDEIGVLAEIASGMDGEDHGSELRRLSPQRRLGLVAGLVQEAFGGSAPSAGELTGYCDVYRAHLLARRGYRASRADVAITLVQPASEPRRSGGPAERAWRELAGLGVHTRVAPGNHRTMVTGAGAAAVAEVIRAVMVVPEARETGSVPEARETSTVHR